MSGAGRGKGDEAVAALESELAWLGMSQAPFGEKLAKVDAAFKSAIRPFAESGDDRVLSRMRNAAAESVAELASAEAERLAQSGGGAETVRRAVERVRREAVSVTWLPEGFRSSISAEMAMAAAGLAPKG